MSDFFKSLVDGIDDGAQHVKNAVGTAVEVGAHRYGKGLDQLGLHGVAEKLDHAADWVADHVGAHVGEAELGESEDPKALVHGDVGALNEAVQHLHQFAAAFGETAAGMERMDTAHWQGKSADAFRQKFHPHPKMWADARQACGDVSAALGDYVRVVDWAQKQAAEAIDLYRRGKQDSERAQQEHEQQVDNYNSAMSAAQESGIRGPRNGPAPTKPGQFQDPGAAEMQQAQHILDDARKQRDSAAEQAKHAMEAAAQLAPPEPTFAERLSADIHDVAAGGMESWAHEMVGLGEGLGDMVKLARSVAPFDPYNMTHPAQYVQGLSTTAAGLVHASMHPTETVTGLIGTGWSSDPGAAFGRLGANALMMFASGGAGGAAEAAGGAALKETAVVESGVGREITSVAERSVKPVETTPAGIHPEPTPPSPPPQGNFGPGWQEREFGQSDFGPTGEPTPTEPQPGEHPGEHQPDDTQPGGHHEPERPAPPDPMEIDRLVDQRLEADSGYQQARSAVDEIDRDLREGRLTGAQAADAFRRSDELSRMMGETRQRITKEIQASYGI